MQWCYDSNSPRASATARPLPRAQCSPRGETGKPPGLRRSAGRRANARPEVPRVVGPHSPWLTSGASRGRCIPPIWTLLRTCPHVRVRVGIQVFVDEGCAIGLAIAGSLVGAAAILVPSQESAPVCQQHAEGCGGSRAVLRCRCPPKTDRPGKPQGGFTCPSGCRRRPLPPRRPRELRRCRHDWTFRLPKAATAR